MTKMKMFFGAMILSVVLLGFTSCAEELVASDEASMSEYFAESRSTGDVYGATTDAGEEAMRGKCFELTYPVTLQYPDQTTVEVTSQEQHKEVRKAWLESVLGEGAKPRKLPKDQRLTFVFPIEITKNGETKNIDSKEALKELVKECRPRGGKRPGKGERGRRGFKKGCAELVFPLSVKMPDGTQIDADSKEDMRTQVKAWKEANPEVEGRPEFVFPVDAKKKDGTTVTANTQEELKEIMTECKGDRKERCFKLVYPVTMTMPDGTQITGDSKRDIGKKIRAWAKENGRPEQRPELVYPVTVTLSDDTTQVVNSKEEMKALKESCKQQ